jgi:multidrug efflux pump subunit AcrA (membrane-fusion protein)
VEYCRKSQVRSLTVIPLKRDASTPNGQPDSEVIGILVGEQFSDSDSGFRERLESAATHAATALQNAVEYESLPFRSLLRRLRNSRRLSLFYKQPKFVCGLLALVSALLGMVFIPADFEVSGTGLMQPAVRRGVFAPTDGVVREVRVAHGERCAQNDVLAVLSKPQLEQELARITGELQTAQKRMDSIQAARLENTEQTAVARERYFHLTAEEEEVKALIQSLQSQRRVLDAQQSELTVRSPLAGQVLTWNVREILESRPVARGDLLMMVADVDGPWILEIQVPDDQIGYVLDAQDAGGTEPTVTFLLGTDPGTTYHGTLQRIGKGVETVDERSYVLVTAAIDKAQIPRLHPGATAIPRIHCGRRSLGFVWFHGLWNAIRTRLLF